MFLNRGEWAHLGDPYLNMGLPRPMSNLGITTTPRFLFSIRDARRNKTRPSKNVYVCTWRGQDNDPKSSEASPSYLVEPSSGGGTPGEGTLREGNRDTADPGGATPGEATLREWPQDTTTPGWVTPCVRSWNDCRRRGLNTIVTKKSRRNNLIWIKLVNQILIN